MCNFIGVVRTLVRLLNGRSFRRSEGGGRNGVEKDLECGKETGKAVRSVKEVPTSASSGEARRWVSVSAFFNGVRIRKMLGGCGGSDG